MQMRYVSDDSMIRVGTMVAALPQSGYAHGRYVSKFVRNHKTTDGTASKDTDEKVLRILIILIA